MLKNLDGLQFKLFTPLKSTDARIKLPASAAKRLNTLAIGDHIYLTLVIHNRREVVKYTHTETLSLNLPTIAVQRGQHDTDITSFPINTCVYAPLTMAILEEWWAEKNCDCGGA